MLRQLQDSISGVQVLAKLVLHNLAKCPEIKIFKDISPKSIFLEMCKKNLNTFSEYHLTFDKIFFSFEEVLFTSHDFKQLNLLRRRWTIVQLILLFKWYKFPVF